MKIYLDMDGVICNFERKYFERYGELPGSMRDRKEFSANWIDFVTTRQFENLDWWPGAHELLEYVGSLKNIEIEILSSSGGAQYHDFVNAQKVKWLKEKGLPYKPNIVAGRKNKSKYASPDTILIDDTYDVIQAFIGAGGIGIHHKEVGNTLMLLKSIVAKQINI